MSDLYSKIPQPLQNIGCQELTAKGGKGGWVRKRHFANKLKIFRWPKVYLVISEGCIYYFRNEFCKCPSGKFSLFGFNSVTRASGIKESEAIFPFKIDHTHKNEFKSYFFACSSGKEMKEWMKAIKEELTIANDSQKREGDYYYTQGFSLKTEQTSEAQGLSNDSGFGHSCDGDSSSITYKDIEEDIYDNPTSCQLPKDYGSYTKRVDEASDDEIIPDDGPPPLPVRQRAGSVQKKRRKRTKKKKVGEDVPDISKVTVSDRESDPGKIAAGALAAEMKNLFGNKKPGEKKCVETLPRELPVEPPVEAAADDDEEEEDDEGDNYWKSIHFEGEKEKASEIIRDIGVNGVFLVRGGEQGQVLVVFADNMPTKYRIQVQDEKYFLAQSGPKADSLEELLFEYFTHDLPNNKIKLTTPFQLYSPPD